MNYFKEMDGSFCSEEEHNRNRCFMNPLEVVPQPNFEKVVNLLNDVFEMEARMIRILDSTDPVLHRMRDEILVLEKNHADALSDFMLPFMQKKTDAAQSE